MTQNTNINKQSNSPSIFHNKQKSKSQLPGRSQSLNIHLGQNNNNKKNSNGSHNKYGNKNNIEFEQLQLPRFHSKPKEQQHGLNKNRNKGKDPYISHIHKRKKDYLYGNHNNHNKNNKNNEQGYQYEYQYKYNQNQYPTKDQTEKSKSKSRHHYQQKYQEEDQYENKNKNNNHLLYKNVQTSQYQKYQKPKKNLQFHHDHGHGHNHHLLQSQENKNVKHYQKYIKTQNTHNHSRKNNGEGYAKNNTISIKKIDNKNFKNVYQNQYQRQKQKQKNFGSNLSNNQNQYQNNNLIKYSPNTPQKLMKQFLSNNNNNNETKDKQRIAGSNIKISNHKNNNKKEDIIKQSVEKHEKQLFSKNYNSLNKNKSKKLSQLSQNNPFTQRKYKGNQKQKQKQRSQSQKKQLNPSNKSLKQLSKKSQKNLNSKNNHNHNQNQNQNQNDSQFDLTGKGNKIRIMKTKIQQKYKQQQYIQQGDIDVWNRVSQLLKNMSQSSSDLKSAEQYITLDNQRFKIQKKFYINIIQQKYKNKLKIHLSMTRITVYLYIQLIIHNLDVRSILNLLDKLLQSHKFATNALISQNDKSRNKNPPAFSQFNRNNFQGWMDYISRNNQFVHKNLIVILGKRRIPKNQVFKKMLENSGKIGQIQFLQIIDKTLKWQLLRMPSFPYLPIMKSRKDNKESSNDHKHSHHLILDLDQTLIHFEAQKQLFHVRPYAQQFIQRASKHFQVTVFTAATKQYADQIIDQIDKQKNISHRLYRNHLTFIEETAVKDLSMLGRPIQKTLIVDNISSNYRLQPDNGIHIKSWYGSDDDQVLAKLFPLLIKIKQNFHHDLRQGLKQHKKFIEKQITIDPYQESISSVKEIKQVSEEELLIYQMKQTLK